MMESVNALIHYLDKKQIISTADIEFAHLWNKIDPSITREQLVIFLASLHYQEKGHVAVNEDMVLEFMEVIGIPFPLEFNNQIEDSILSGKPGSTTPFINFDGLLYQQKSFMQENKLAHWLVTKSNYTFRLSESELATINEKFENHSEDQQLEALYKSFSHALLFITGGPGTGKTYTVQQIIEAHYQLFGESYIIKIAAPTGKAAQRINDSLSSEGEPKFKAVTIHQLLGARDLLSGFNSNKENPISADLIIIDEASMMDLNLWNALTQAVSSRTKLIIVGDPFQLASVESGSVLSDICHSSDGQSKNSNSLSRSIIKLEKRHRFSSESGIHQFADAVNSMDTATALNILTDARFNDVRWIEPSTKVMDQIIQSFALSPDSESDESNLVDYRMLSVLRNGPFGCTHINKIAEKEIKKKLGLPQSVRWFKNRVVMATKNEYKLGVQNGEIGIFNEIREEIEFSSQKKIPVHLLKNYESAYCITVHKSQGSEYKHVAIILPDQINSILSKELLYTAVTRTRESVLVVGNKKILTHCITKKTKRKSGLRAQLSSLLV